MSSLPTVFCVLLCLNQAQLVAYIMLIVPTETPKNGTYSIYSVSLAMFLMVSTSVADVRAGYLFLVWGRSLARKVFGILLVANAVLLEVASIRILFMEADDDAELVIGAAAILFIEDVVRE